MAKKTTEYGRPSVWNQRTDQHVSSDKESDRIFEQMTGDGLISTEDNKKKPFSNRRI